MTKQKRKRKPRNYFVCLGKKNAFRSRTLSSTGCQCEVIECSI